MATFGLCGRQHKEQSDGKFKYSFSFPEGGVVVDGIPGVDRVMGYSSIVNKHLVFLLAGDGQ
jgi:hypothetical protein